MGTHKCLNCGEAITPQFAICVNCEKTLGNSAYDWPGWLRYLWNDVQRERRRDRKNDTHEITLELAGFDHE